MARRQNDEDPRLFMEYFNLKRRVADWSHWDLNIKELAKQVRGVCVLGRGGESGTRRELSMAQRIRSLCVWRRWIKELV